MNVMAGKEKFLKYFIHTKNTFLEYTSYFEIFKAKLFCV